MKYTNQLSVWKALGTDAYTKVRDEIVGTGDASTTVFSLDHDNIVSGSTTISLTGEVVKPTYSLTGSPSPSCIGDYQVSGNDQFNRLHYFRIDKAYDLYDNGGGDYWLTKVSPSGEYFWRGNNTGVIGTEFISVLNPSGSATTTGSAFGLAYTGSTYYPIFTTTPSPIIDLDDGELIYSSAPGISGSIVADYFYADIPDSEMVQFINEAEKDLENMTGRSFNVQTTSDEYQDVGDEQKVFYTKNYPVINLTASHNVNSVVDSPSWTTSVEGLGNDYLMDTNDKLIGKLEYIDNCPYEGLKKLKLNYTYGYSTIPDDVKELATLLTLRKMINSAVYKAIFKGRDAFSPARLDEIEVRIIQLTNILRKQNISLI
jgi:hypothetical protein